jgi:3' terminal RNA ribose 2'-O-methyltransferase Hen1
MLLTISTTHQPATDLGYLLHKNPAKCQTFSLSFGNAHVFYPEATLDHCTVALLLDIDPIQLVRGKSGSKNSERTLEQYVNDRSYTASSFLSVAIAKVFGTAKAGKCKERENLTKTPLPLTAKISAIKSNRGADFFRQLFEPLGYSIAVQNYPLDKHFSSWGDSNYYSLELSGNCCLSELLNHLYVMIPVLDLEKHYWIGDEEVDKLLTNGAGWLASHPAKEIIADRYLKKFSYLTRSALAQLTIEENIDPDKIEEESNSEEEKLEKPISLNQQRLESVVNILKQKESRKIVDIGCGQGNLLRLLAKDNYFTELLGVDVSYRALEVAKERLERLNLAPIQRQRLNLIQGSLTYRDSRLSDYDAATVIEVIEHLDLDRLASLERVLFEFARPNLIVITTPNIEYNVMFPNLAKGKLRHRDHRFEWTRMEFQNWAKQIGDRYYYTVEFVAVGNENEVVGSPTQMAVFDLDS